MTADQIIDGIIQHEGSEFTDDPADRGGPTKFGITLDLLREWRHEPGLDATAVEALTEGDARTILRQKYLLATGLNRVGDVKVQALAVDMLVNHGLRGGTLIIQRALSQAGDGVLGPLTLASLCSTGSGNHVFEKLLAGRIRFYGRLIGGDPSQARFASGWLNRCADFLAPS